MSHLNQNNEHKPYYMVHNVLYDMADEFFKSIEQNKSLVQVKGREVLTKDKERASGRRQWMDNYQWYFPVWFKRGKSNWVHVQCENWFRDNCDGLIKGFFHSYGYKDIAEAIKGTGTFNFLCFQWDVWFQEKRRKFMEKQNNDVVKATGRQAKMPGSHGGIANLLKTLTKTMQLQGSSIQSIAKVQYTICMQAGVYIPDEFLTDVAVGMDYNRQIEG